MDPHPDPLPEGEGESRPRMIRWGLLAAVLVLVADQASKWWVLNVLHLPELGSVPLLPVLSLTMVWNQGVTFGLFHQDRRGRSLAAGGGGAGGGGRAGGVDAAGGARAGRRALGAIAGGAVGNVVDRMRFGAVVDFIHAHAFGWSWYVFNVADAAIVCGVGGAGPGRAARRRVRACRSRGCGGRSPRMTTILRLLAAGRRAWLGGLQRRRADPHLRPDPRRPGRVPGDHARAALHAARLLACARRGRAPRGRRS